MAHLLVLFATNLCSFFYHRGHLRPPPSQNSLSVIAAKHCLQQFSCSTSHMTTRMCCVLCLVYLPQENNKKTLNISFTDAADYMKCPVCLNVEVDPCTLRCGHTFCQLCLARMWKDNKKICPVCKQMWRVFPAISYDHR